ncbi:hypothetical protein B1964_01750 [Gordonia sp. i37]|nr:hypothetical protein B1964_01750 [Gordonia sp. i37]
MQTAVSLRQAVLPTAGSTAWIALDDDDPRKAAALLVAGSRWVLEQELDRLDAEREASKAAAIEIAQARDWARVAQRIRGRDAAYIERKAS